MINNKLKIDTLDLVDFDINNLSNTLDILEDNYIKNIFYSDPFYNDNLYDYEFRVTFDNDNLILDEIKYNETLNFDECIKIKSHILTKPFKNISHLLKQNIDIRDEKTLLTDDILYLIDKNDPSFNELIDKNKCVVLKELYKDILESILPI